MKRLCTGILVLLMIASPVFAGAVKFSAEDAADSSKFAKKYLAVKVKKLKKLGVNKIVILECFGEYVTSTEVTNSASSQRYTERINTQTTTLNLGKDFYTDTSNRVYAAVKSAFESNGIEVISPETLLANETYISFNLEEEKEGRGASAGMFKPTVVEKTQKVSATGLGIFPLSPLKMIKLVMNLGEITQAVGAEGFIQINFKVDKDNKFKPIVDKFEIKFSGDIKATEVGFKGNKKMRYDLLTQWEPILNLKAEIASTDEVMEGKKGPLNVTNYDKALMDILYAVTDGFSAELKETLSK